MEFEQTTACVPQNIWLIMQCAHISYIFDQADVTHADVVPIQLP